jgi:4-hydroxybutyrate CoA-transferase
MKEWETTYKNKIMSAKNALLNVGHGARVVVGHACGEPQFLVEALVARAAELKDVEVVHMVALGPAKYAQPGMEANFIHNSLFVGTTSRRAIAEGRGRYTPCYFSEIPRLFTEKFLPVDVTLMQVTPPDEDGFCSLGVSVDYTLASARSDRITIAQVNKCMPRTLGEKMHIDEIDCIVEKNEPIIEIKPSVIGDVERAIGENTAALIRDGSTLQLGIGGIPDALLLFLKGKKDLGIHTEMFSDGVVDLAKEGVITNRKKTINNGKFVATFLMGTRKLYDFVHENTFVDMRTVDYTNDVNIIGQHEKMVSINSAIQVDLMGQVNAEMIGNEQFSGVGGQVDFIRGTSRSSGGKSIIALPSTAAGGKISRITPHLDHGAAVTTSRNDVQFVVTEYGIADLRGKSLDQRAKTLIAIAHPDFRRSLMKS